jgi:ferredoxin/coenzyme F420-reducing hydrogenase delta subunit
MLILLCEDLENLGNGLDLSAISESVREEREDVEIRIEKGLCAKLGSSLHCALNGKWPMVLGLCSGDFSKVELHSSVRKAGLDPFGVEVVNLGAYCALIHPRALATEKAKLLLEAGVARSQAFSGSLPLNLKLLPVWNQKVSRRSLFSLPPIRYEAVPSIREEACAVDQGCRVCAAVCPHEALASHDGRMVLNKTACTSCGACVSACPRIAMDFPGAQPRQIHAQIGALLRGEALITESRGILFVCGKGTATLERLAHKGLSYPAGWLPVEVPCLGMVTPSWHLECLNTGAAAVGILPCGQEECRFGQREIIRGRVDYVRELLRLLGESPDHVALFDSMDDSKLAGSLSCLPTLASEDGGRDLHDGSFLTPRAAAALLLGLAERYGASLEGSLDHPYSPFGDVEIKDGCTLCGACVDACPTDSLSIQRDGDSLALTFDPQLCIRCSECVPVCPEKILWLKAKTDLGRLSLGRIPVCQTGEARCEACGGPIAPKAMLEKIVALLGSDPSVSAISRRCLSCRNFGAAGVR